MDARGWLRLTPLGMAALLTGMLTHGCGGANTSKTDDNGTPTPAEADDSPTTTRSSYSYSMDTLRLESEDGLDLDADGTIDNHLEAVLNLMVIDMEAALEATLDALDNPEDCPPNVYDCQTVALESVDALLSALTIDQLNATLVAVFEEGLASGTIEFQLEDDTQVDLTVAISGLGLGTGVTQSGTFVLDGSSARQRAEVSTAARGASRWALSVDSPISGSGTVSAFDVPITLDLTFTDTIDFDRPNLEETPAQASAVEMTLEILQTEFAVDPDSIAALSGSFIPLPDWLALTEELVALFNAQLLPLGIQVDETALLAQIETDLTAILPINEAGIPRVGMAASWEGTGTEE